MKGERPINADEAAPDSSAKAGEKKEPAAKPEPNAKAPAPAPPGERRPIPTALKLIGGAVLVAIVFIVAAILGGGDSEEPSQPQGPAPTVPAESRDSESEEPAEQSATELGYPTFATANTTRIGGSDPASNAAAAALAVYPAAKPALQPQAVTLVGESDWQAAIAAAALIAEPVGAPILFSGPDGAPQPTVEALEALEPRGGGDTNGAGAFTVGDVAQPEAGKVTRVKGSGAGAAAAIAALREQLVGSAPAHYLVAPEDPTFAMPAAAWAARSGDPVLFAGKDDLPKPTAAALRRHPKVPVYVLGPPTAISSDVVREIDKAGGKVSRVSGEEPVANAIAFARYSDGEFGWNINDPGHGFVVARYDSTLDAAAAAPLSAAGTWGPLLLTASGATLPPVLRDYLLDVKPGYTTDPTRAFYNHVWVIGDQDLVEASQQAELDELAALAKIGGGSE